MTENKWMMKRLKIPKVIYEAWDISHFKNHNV